MSQGEFPADGEAGAAARPGTGTLVRVAPGGALTVVAHGLDRPTSLEITGTTALVVTMGGEVRRIPNLG